jgi:hypothetical protein
MPRNTRATRQEAELLLRDVVIESFRASVGARVEEGQCPDRRIVSGPCLDLYGRLGDPVKGVKEVLITLYPDDVPGVGHGRSAAIGSCIGLKPQMTVVLPWSRWDFGSMWALALSGHLRFASLCFTQPRYGKGQVVSASFSTWREEEDSAIPP